MNQNAPASGPSAVRTQFSLTEGDVVNNAFGVLRIGSRRPRHLLYRSLILSGSTWGMLAFFATCQGLYGTQITGSNFFADFAAYAQFLLALPIFVVAEAIIVLHTREAAKAFLSSGVVQPQHVDDIECVHRTVARLRRLPGADFSLIGLAYVLAYYTIGPELGWPGMPMIAEPDTWHSIVEGNVRRLTVAGGWAMFFALPLLNYWWLRWIWKIAIWTWYLYRISRMRLMLVASHPDRTGGIGFVSRVQARFAWIIFAYGISNVAAVVAYKIGVEGVSMAVMSVWGPVVGFILLAPLLFTLPLFMFTKQLFRTKKRALRIYRRLATERARLLEKQWLNIGARQLASGQPDLEQHTSFSTMFSDIERMRIVPFDFRSIGQLVGATVGSVATALPLLGLENRLTKWLQFLSSVLSPFN